MDSPFITVKTVHIGEVAWYWTDEKLHDTDYHIKVNDAIDKKVAELTKAYDVQRDTDYRCQWEGVQITGSELWEVEEAARHIARHLAQFKGVRPLGE